MSEATRGNFKGKLVEACSKSSQEPTFESVGYGPDHDKVHLCICRFQGDITTHQGKTIKEAENLASKEMLEILNPYVYAFSYDIHQQKPHTSFPEVESIMRSLISNDDNQYEVLSLYGDSILRYHLARYLFDNYSGIPEGKMSKIISKLLEKEIRAEIAVRLCLKGLTIERAAKSFSAMLGKSSMIYGDNYCAKLIEKLFKTECDVLIYKLLAEPSLDAINDSTLPISIHTTINNDIGAINEHVQRHKLEPPTYNLVKEEGAAHSPTFTMQCIVNKTETLGVGNTKQLARNRAASKMLTILRKNDDKNRVVWKNSKMLSTQLNSKIKRFKTPALKQLKKDIGWKHFDCLDDLQAAFTHPSKNQSINYERLEFLGDAIIKKVLFSYIITHYPDIVDKNIVSPRMDELVCESTQKDVALRLNIDKHIFSDSQITDRILSNVLEAMIAVIYLDAEKKKKDNKGIIKRSEYIIIEWFMPEIEKVWGKSNNKAKRSITSLIKKRLFGSNKVHEELISNGCLKQVKKSNFIKWNKVGVEKWKNRDISVNYLKLVF
eukprot:gene7756-10537_t